MRLSPELRTSLDDFNTKWGRALLQACVALIVGFGGAQFWTTGLGQRLDIKIAPAFYQIRGKRPPPSDVVIVGIDDTSYLKLNASTNLRLPRKYFAEALERIVNASPKAVILDAKLPNEHDIDPASDDRIVAALKSGPTSIWTGALPPDPDDPDSQIAIPSDSRFREAAKMELSMAVYGTEDRVLCYIRTPAGENESLYNKVPISKALVELATIDVPTPGPNDLINFYGPKLTIPRLSLSDFVGAGSDVASASAKLQNKIVLIGYQSLQQGKGPGNSDEFVTPFSSKPVSGVEIHGNIVGNLIDYSWLRRYSPMNEYLIVYLSIFFVVGLALFFPGLKCIAVIVIFMTLATVYSYVRFAYQNFWVSGLGTVLPVCFVTLVISGVYFLWRTHKYQKYLNKFTGFQREREL